MNFFRRCTSNRLHTLKAVMGSVVQGIPEQLSRHMIREHWAVSHHTRAMTQTPEEPGNRQQ